MLGVVFLGPALFLFGPALFLLGPALFFLEVSSALVVVGTGLVLVLHVAGTVAAVGTFAGLRLLELLEAFGLLDVLLVLLRLALLLEVRDHHRQTHEVDPVKEQPLRLYLDVFLGDVVLARHVLQQQVLRVHFAAREVVRDLLRVGLLVLSQDRTDVVRVRRTDELPLEDSLLKKLVAR